MFKNYSNRFRSRGGRRFALAFIPALLLSSPLAASQPASPAALPTTPPAKPAEAARPVTSQTVTAKDVATTPLNDLNVTKTKIPPVLEAAIEQPYDTAGLKSCARIVGAVSELNAVLGDDLDVQHARGAALSPGRLAKSVLGSFIPFEGVIREISGARSAQARMQLAIYAGSERRAFLKGVGLSRGCPYPARPAGAVGATRRHAAKHRTG